MKKYSRIKEQADQQEEPEVILDSQVTKILRALRDENFGNDSQRRKFCALMVSMHNSKDPRVRKIFKMIGDYCTDAIKDII